MLRINELKLPVSHGEEALKKKVSKLLGGISDFKYIIVRRSLDARKKPDLYYNYIVDIEVSNEAKVLKRADKKVVRTEEKKYVFPYHTELIGDEKRPVVIGLGPAGLFCGLYLARNGFKPIVVERGECVEDRTKTVKKLWEEGILNPESNAQFGEGGAGSFSDGKLNTLVKDKYGRNKAVLRDLVSFGAPEEIIYDHKPHVGTDKLTKVVSSISQEIIRLGGEIHYNTRIDNFEINEGKLISVSSNDGKFALKNHPIVIATGHSARDTIEILNQKGVVMTPKAFAVGLRVEHEANLINLSQYGVEKVDELGNAAYKLTHKCADQRGVYSFCMCPGGYVINASSEDGMIAVNGMSYSGRDAKYSNSAIIITVMPEDYGDGVNPMSGIEFQRTLEKRAFSIGEGRVPYELYSEYKNENILDISIDPMIKGLSKHAEVHEILPKNLSKDFIEGMEAFGKQIKGFNNDNTIVIGVESRTSSPVKILRDETGMSNIEGLFPCGEGAGYAGGITSAAMDGILIAEKVAEYILK